MQQERKAPNAFTKRKELLTKAFSLCLKKRIIKTVCQLEYSSACMGVHRRLWRRTTCGGWRAVRCGFGERSYTFLGLTKSVTIGRSIEACRWGEGYHICYQQKTESLAWSYPTTWWSCPITYWGENNRKEATWKTSSGNAGLSKGWQPLRSGQKTRLRSRTIRKDLPGHKHTYTYVQRGVTVKIWIASR